MSKRRIQRSNTKGQALVEFALVVPVLLLVTMGIFDLGFAIYAQNMVSNAAVEGARTGILISKQDSDIIARVHASAPSLSNLQVTINPLGPRTISNFNTPITVTVTYTYTPITPIIGQIVTGSGLPLKASATMNIEGILQYGP